jgi:phosphoglycerate kinase
VAILGGAKISGKIDTLENLLPRLDRLVIGGGMANTFLAAQGYSTARSLVEEDRISLAGEILERAKAADTAVYLPTDLVVTNDFANPTHNETVAASAIPEGTLAVDIGPASRAAFAAAVADAGTIFWNGPQGVFEKPPFDQGTVAVAQAVAASPAFKVIGGGETVAAAHRAGVAERIDHISTGGGASLELLAGRALPGVTALEKTS